MISVSISPENTVEAYMIILTFLLLVSMPFLAYFLGKKIGSEEERELHEMKEDEKLLLS